MAKSNTLSAANYLFCKTYLQLCICAYVSHSWLLILGHVVWCACTHADGLGAELYARAIQKPKQVWVASN